MGLNNVCALARLENSKGHQGNLGVTHGTWRDTEYDWVGLRGLFFLSPRPSASFP